MAGAALLLSTPAGVFAKVVPFLAAAASIALLLGPRLAARRDRRLTHPWLILPLGLLGMSVYNSYFGAGSGVMIHALLLLTVDRRLVRANALKSMLLGPATVVSAVAFSAFGPVDWFAVAPLTVGMFAGSSLGPLVARRLPSTLLRWLIASIGLGLAIQMWFSP